MLIYQSRLNEDRLIKTGLDADSVADKLESLKQQILDNQEIVQRLKEINILDYIVSNYEIDDYSVNDVATLEKWNEFLKSILEKQA